MIQTKKSFAVAAALAVSIAFTSSAEAAGYAGNKCVAKKQSSLAKYTKAVIKAWTKYPADATARDEAIANAATKLDGTWTKEEAKAVKKNATCNESTATSVQAAAIVDAEVSGVSGEATLVQLSDYMKAAMKAWGKYLKDPVKDPAKATLQGSLSTASTEELTGASPAITAAAASLLDDLVAATTRAPNYPDTFQTIVPGNTVFYGKQELEPRCVDGTPYMFFAKRGNSNNVLMYYQGGGACWDDISCNQIPPNGAPIDSICSRTAEASDNPALTTTGFANYNDPANPFYDWNVVFVTYCTCDVHWGSKRPNYGARHFGRINAAVAEKFAREHFVDPDRVFSTGSSAGSYGAIMNAYWLMKEVWPNADHAILGDGGVGVITKQWLDKYINNWGIQENFPTDLGLPSNLATDLSLVDLIDGLSQKFPNARFGNYDSSYDGGGGSQTNFFQVMRYPTPPGSNIINNWTLYWKAACDWNACMREFKAENASRSEKFHYFTGAGSRHTIFGSDKIYTETKSTDGDGNGVTFAAWVTAMINDSPDWVDVDCNNPGGNCHLTNTCQGGTNAGGFCSQKCSGGLNAGNDCVNNLGCGNCSGGDLDGTPCSATADCLVEDPGVDGVCVGTCANSNADCPGGSCQLDPDTANAPYNNDDTVTCPVTTCPCGPNDARCYGGINDGDPCDTTKPLGGAEDCKANPADVNEVGACSYVNCSAQ